jgi:integrase
MNNTNTVQSLDTGLNTNTNNIIQFPQKTKGKNPYTGKRTNSTVQPIKDKDDIERAKEYFLTHNTRYTGINLRNHMLFILGINCARRIEDILDIRIGDIINDKGQFKSKDGWITINEDKTNKEASFQLHPYVKEVILDY